MDQPALHFLYEPEREPGASFAARLIELYGQADFEHADTIVTVGGDGMLLQGLRMAGDRKVFGLTPPGSTSRGFWTNHDVTEPDMLLERMQSATSIPVTPLKSEITFENGNKRLIHAFNEVAIEHSSGQATKIGLTARFAQAVMGPVTIDGDGFLFSTALGSTGSNRSYGGPAMDIRNHGIILNGKGLIDPHKGLNPVVSTACTVFDVDILSLPKRPVRIDYDGLNIMKDEDGSLVSKLKIAAAPEKAVRLMLTCDPGLRTFSEMKPH